MSVYIILGLLVSGLLTAYIWLGNVTSNENLKIFASLAVITTGWLAWPGYLIAGFMLLMRRLSQKQQASE